MNAAFLDSAWARGFSLVGALALMALMTVYPRGLTRDGVAIDHALLTLIMWGLSAGFVHGVGFVPRHPVLRVLLGPIVAWLLMGLGLAFFIPHFIGV